MTPNDTLITISWRVMTKLILSLFFKGLVLMNNPLDMKEFINQTNMNSLTITNNLKLVEKQLEINQITSYLAERAMYLSIISIHYYDVTMSAMASQITSLTIVCSTVYSRRRSKKTLQLRVAGLCAGNSPVTGEFPAQMASNAENVSIWWRHHDCDIIGLAIR